MRGENPGDGGWLVSLQAAHRGREAALPPLRISRFWRTSVVQAISMPLKMESGGAMPLWLGVRGFGGVFGTLLGVQRVWSEQVGDVRRLWQEALFDQVLAECV